MPRIRLIGGNSEPEIFVSLEHIPLVVSDLRKKLPQLRQDLKRRWPVVGVHVRNREATRTNPYVPTEVATAARFGLEIVFGGAVLFGTKAIGAAGTEFGKEMGKELTSFVRNWVKRVISPKAVPRKQTSRNRKTK